MGKGLRSQHGAVEDIQGKSVLQGRNEGEEHTGWSLERREQPKLTGTGSMDPVPLTCTVLDGLGSG